MPLTDTAIRNVKPIEKTRKLFDGGGLYLEISPRGGKWWRWKYRFGGNPWLGGKTHGGYHGPASAGNGTPN